MKSEYELDIEGMIAVRFHNAMQDATKSALRITEEVERNIYDMEKFLPRAHELKRAGYSNWHLTRMDSDDMPPLRIPNFFDKETAAQIRATYDALTKGAAALNSLNNELFAYLKDDGSHAENYQKYTAQKARLRELIAETRKSAAAFDTGTRALANAGEARTLPKNPAGPFLMRMREALDAVAPMPALVANSIFAERTPYLEDGGKREPETDDEKNTRLALASETADRLDVLCANFANLVAKNKNEDTAPIRFENENAVAVCKDALSDFYGYYADNLMKQVAEDTAELRKKGTNRDASRLQYAISNLISQHDRYVEMYNIWANGDQAIKRRRD